MYIDMAGVYQVSLQLFEQMIKKGSNYLNLYVFMMSGKVA